VVPHQPFAQSYHILFARRQYMVYMLAVAKIYGSSATGHQFWEFVNQ
jgi:hypothetical protein